MSLLLSGSKIGNVALINKIVMPPMCVYKSDDSGSVKNFHKIHYAARALGGVGLIIVEATAVEPRGRITDKDLGLWCDEQISGHKELIDGCKEFGSKMAIQLAHAGRKSEARVSTPIAPSAIKFSDDSQYKMPNEAYKEDIQDVKNAFVSAAKRAEQAGYDMVEIHAAHGYFLFEFLSSITNKRTDEYGGDIKNRCKLTLEVAKAVLDAISIPVIVRISADDWADGFVLENAVYLSKELEKLGVAAIHVSAGGNQLKPKNLPKFVPLYQCNYAKEIKKAVSIPVIAVGIINSAGEGEALLLGEICDFVAYGRELLRSPNFAMYCAKDLGESELIDFSYKRAF